MRLSPVSRNELVRRLRMLGWEGPLSGGKHQFMVKEAIQLTIPNPHRSGEIGVNLLKLILKEAGIARKEWLSAR